MENYFTKKFKKYYLSLNNYQKQVIIWCSICNHECPEEYYQLVWDSVELYNKQAVKNNYCEKHYLLKKPELKAFDNNEKIYLSDKFKELDGTLLIDVIWISLKSHKIFKNI
jgi:hypothetical protein